MGALRDYPKVPASASTALRRLWRLNIDEAKGATCFPGEFVSARASVLDLARDAESAIAAVMCAAPLHYEQIGGMRVQRDGAFSARCPKCGWSGETDGRARLCEQRRGV